VSPPWPGSSRVATPTTTPCSTPTVDYGVYGVPETFVIDRAGVVRYKHIGPITPDVLRDEIEPLLRRLNA